MKKEKDASFYNKNWRDHKYAKRQYPSNPQKSLYFPLWDYILNLINSKERIVDFGCGGGCLIKLAFQRKLNVMMGVDFSKEAIKRAKNINPEHSDIFIVGDLYDKKIYDKVKFDTAILSEVLEHLENDLGILTYFQKNTHIIISIPKYDSPAHVRYFKNGRGVIHRYEDLINIKSIKSVRSFFVVDSYKK